MEFADLFSSNNYYLTRWLFKRAMGFQYLLVFVIALNQFRTLVGRYGLLPIDRYLKVVRFRDAPSLFWINSSDRFIYFLSFTGLLLSVLAITGVSDSNGMPLSIITWTLLWIIYQSFVNTGQVFYSFGWEILLLEMGFLSIFLGPDSVKPPAITIWFLLWVLFRIMFGAGLIKIRGDRCWRDLTCMYYHYETQPLPNPLSWYFHWLPMYLNKLAVVFTHFIELVVPFGFFAPQPIRYIAGVLTILFQVLLILSGNLSWLNYITIILCISCFDDKFLSGIFSLKLPMSYEPSLVWVIVLTILSISIILLSIRPAKNLFSHHQLMNASFEPFHIVNTYGAFGSMNRKRFEIIIEGTTDQYLSESTEWIEYQFKAKPGDIYRKPPVISPYQLHLDWLMWFEAMLPLYLSSWFIIFLARLLANDRATLKLLKFNPFPEKGPAFIRCALYRYNFTRSRESSSAAWWDRSFITYLLDPVSLDGKEFIRMLDEIGWRSKNLQK